MAESNHPRPSERQDRELIDAVVTQLMKDEQFRHSLLKALHTAEGNLSEMTRNYPHYKRHLYEELRKEFEQTVSELPHEDLESIIRDEGGQPLETFINELE